MSPDSSVTLLPGPHRRNTNRAIHPCDHPFSAASYRDEVRYIYSTFPIVERQENDASDDYRSCDLCLAWINALAAGYPDAEIE